MKYFRIILQLCGFAYVIYRCWYAPEGIYMADPVTLILLGTGVMAAGQIQAGRAAKVEAQSAQNIANYNAAIQEQEAEAIRAKGEFEKVRQVKEGARIKSALKAKIAGQGAIGSGLLEEEQAAELELENLLIGYGAETEAQRAESQAEIDRATGRLARQRGRARKRAGYIGAGATLLTGFGAAGLVGAAPKTAEWTQKGTGKMGYAGGYGGGYRMR